MEVVVTLSTRLIDPLSSIAFSLLGGIDDLFLDHGYSNSHLN
jgi:hypothetical protein